MRNAPQVEVVVEDEVVVAVDRSQVHPSARDHHTGRHVFEAKKSSKFSQHLNQPSGPPPSCYASRCPCC